MSDMTPNLSMPYILPSQAQKHVTHNEALQTLDILVQMVIEAEQATPPADPVEGARYAVALGATSAWAGRDGRIAIFLDGGWIYLQPKQGFTAWFKTRGELRYYNESAGWTVLPVTLPATGRFDRIGINASADDTNRLSLSAPATLLNHAGNGHQLKLNKANAGETASLLYQTDWSGRAEMGLAGNDDFTIKVSPDGGTWKTGLSIDGNGRVSQPNRPLARAHRASGTASAANGSQSGFTTLSIEQGGVTLGAALSGGGNALVVPASGLYFLTLMVSAVSSSGHATGLVRNGSVTLLSLSAPASVPLSLASSSLQYLSAGDSLSLSHSGTAVLDHGPGRTEVNLMML